MADSFVGSACCYTNSRDTTHLRPRETSEVASRAFSGGQTAAVTPRQASTGGR